ncbi:MAG: DUF3857 domain-containing protein [Bacteroidota bacterium]|nr:DUF3857 domain-containing protein [Bacteroidota bacterium]
MLLSLLCAAVVLKGQTQPYGQIDVADLKLTACDFEKGASAMVLFDKTEVTAKDYVTLVTRHKRIKILSEKGLSNANLTISYISKSGFEKISDVEAETMNLLNDTAKITPVDKTLIYNQVTNKFLKTITLSFPGVKVGSVIEYSYQIKIDYAGLIPPWDLQGDLPVRYSELDANIPVGFRYKIFTRIREPYVKLTQEAIRHKKDSIGTHYVWAVKNVPSFKDEPFATCAEDNIQWLRFYPFIIPNRIIFMPFSWGFVANRRMDSDWFKDELSVDLKDEYKMMPEVARLNGDEEKIRFIFNKIKTTVKWNSENSPGAGEGLKKAWEKKQGTSGQINLILYNFLRMAGIDCFPTYVCTRTHGKLEPGLPGMEGFNTMVLTVTTAAKKTYVLDASNKFNSYNAVPFNVLNCYSLMLNPGKKEYAFNVMKDSVPLRKIIAVNALIKPDGKLEGSANILTTGNNKTYNLQQYEELGEAKYKDELRNNDNNLKILTYKRENVQNDTLQLNESVDFKLDLTSSDENYIYVNPTLLTSLNTNPFLSETRQSTIDFGNLNAWSIRSIYKTPPGYKIESLPHGVSMIMPDTSIEFKRMVVTDGNTISIHYYIDFKRAEFAADQYPEIRDFYKKMYEMLNEQIVLKKI